MPVYNLRGVDVIFPFDAYSCQLAYMEKVIQALQEKNNALLESPTGTGKTLCLLCATLAWRESVKKQLMASMPAQPGNAPPGKVLPLPPAGKVLPMPPTGKALPMPPAPEQQPAVKLPLIIYSSRTHSQLAQVMRELKRTDYKVRASVLGSRQQLCQQPNIAKLPSGAANAACKSLVSNKGCEWHRTGRSGGNERFIEEAGSAVLDIEELGKFGRSKRACPFYLSRDLTEKADILFMPYNYLIDARSRRTLDGVAWEDCVLIFDEAHNVESVCSDAASFDLSAVQLASCVTELNKCRGRCMELAQNQPMGSAGLQGGGQGADPTAIGVPNYRELFEKLGVISVVLKRVEEAVAKRALAQPAGYTGAGQELLLLLAECGLTSSNWLHLAQSLEQAVSILGEDEAEAGRSRASQKASTAGCSAVLESLTLAMASEAPLAIRGAKTVPVHKGYRMHIHSETVQGAQVPVLSYWCFVPGAAFAQLEALGVRCLLLTSGTLSPLESFAAELQVPFPVRLENPHIIAKSQVWVGVVPTGPSGVSLNASYQSRSDPAYKEDLGCAIVNFARLVPDGLLVFFPSYGVLTNCLEFWKTQQAGGNTTIWERIVQYKLPVVEPREAALFQSSIDDFTAKLDAPGTSGAVFFAVCRGKVSEGLDFADRAGRAVIITGIPYASTAEPKVKLKRQVLTEERANRNGIMGPNVLSGDEWYTQQAARAVNQAIGRVIRHRNDYGAIILCDARFQGASTQRQLSMWLREYVQVHNNFGIASASITKFFKDTASLPGAKPAPGRGAAAGGGGAFEVLGAPGQAGRGSKAPGAFAAAVRSFPTALDTSGLPDLAARSMASKGAGPSSGGNKSLLDMLSSGSGGGAAAAIGAGREPQDGSRLAALAAGAPAASASTAVGSRGPGLPSTSYTAQVSVRPRDQRREPLPAARPPAQTVVGPAHLVQAHLVQQTATLAAGLSSGGPLQHPRGPSSSSSAANAPTTSSAAATHIPTAAAKTTLGKASAGVWNRAAAHGEPAGTVDGRGSSGPPSSTAAQDGCRPAQLAPKDFMKQLEQQLDKDTWSKVKKLLAEYRSGRNVQQFIEGIVTLLKGASTVQLLWGFTSFISDPQQREWLESLIRAHSLPQTGAGSQPAPAPAAAAPASGASRGAEPPAGPQGSSKSAAVTSAADTILPQKRALQESAANVQPGPKRPSAGPGARAACTLCSASPMETPYKAPCGHMACYSCWLLQLARLQQCQTCDQPCRKKQLVPCFFV